MLEGGAEQEAAVDDELRTRGEGRVVRGEEQQGPGDVGRLAQARDRERFGRVEVGDGASLSAAGSVMKGVAMTPGWMALTRMWSRPSSRAAVLVRPRTAHLLAT